VALAEREAFRGTGDRDVTGRDEAHRVAHDGEDLDAIAAIARGRISVLADLGVTTAINPGGVHIELRPGLGVAVKLAPDFHVGAELYGELAYQSDESGGTSWLGAGPDVAWTYGRFWLSGALLVGLRNVQAAPRVRFGIVF
jgi:hypothetical protein